ncbi:MAG TPA: tetraacyldisaccharide 4'-kinase [Longimicrobiales bacterium]|nr:tetraacyldisaccharide 4'-kinase [Longimicrobiales bacterium]
MSRLNLLARQWWAGELGAAGTALDIGLAPAEAVYRFGVRLRRRAFDRGLLEVQRVAAPVISVGNVAVGGTGKTPFAHWLAVRLQEHGRRPAVLHGGYADDEPELHRRWSPDIPVVVERDRVAGAERALAAGADVLVLDDGFQHRRLGRDLDIVLVSAERWAMPARLLPRGPWREPPSALARADIVVVTRKAALAADARAVAGEIAPFTHAPVLLAHLRPAGWRDRLGPSGPPVGRVLLVSGLAEPGLFEESAKQAGADVAGHVVFPDHHGYSKADGTEIRRVAAGRTVVTTEKDWTKLQPLLDGVDVRLLAQQVIIEDGEDVLEARLSELGA